jgi:hypothetical protein
MRYCSNMRFQHLSHHVGLDGAVTPYGSGVEKCSFSLFAKTFAFCNKKIAKIIENLAQGCERGQIKTRSHLFLQLLYEFAIIFATFRPILLRKAKRGGWRGGGQKSRGRRLRPYYAAEINEKFCVFVYCSCSPEYGSFYQ